MKLWIAIAGALAAGGCGLIDHMTRSAVDSVIHYDSLETLDGDPAQTGLLLLDAMIDGPMSDMALHGVVIVDAAEPDRQIAVGAFRTGRFFRSLSGVVVVSNLRPALYRIVKLRFEDERAWQTVVLPPVAAFEIRVEAGQATYSGQIVRKVGFGQSGPVTTVRRDKTREAVAWTMVNERYAGSPWAPTIEARIAALK